VYKDQGVALGCRVDAPLARKSLRTKGAQLVSPGQRPGFPPSPEIQALKGRNSSIADHFVDVNKMVKPVHPEARELEERITESVTEVLETA
jgi:hypothetical protein